MSKPSGPTTGYLLDSSVVRPILLGTRTYQQYFAAQLQDQPCYITPFIRMEMYRSYLRNVIEFYFTLDLPGITSFSDALTFWSNRYQGSKHKAIQQLVAQLLSQKGPDISLRAKESATQAIGALIQEFIRDIQAQFLLLDTDSPQCARALVQLEFNKAEDPSEALAQFAAAFDDVATCRSQCRIDEFLLQDYRASLEDYLQQATDQPKTAASRGFLAIADTLQTILDQGPSACSCKCCERIGDVVIALDAPRHLQLEHIDQAFDYLCPPIGQPHRKHPSETRFLRGSELTEND
jgi:hypothetical protein